MAGTAKSDGEAAGWVSFGPVNWASLPWGGVLILTGLFHYLVRDAPIDGAVFAAGGLAVGIDAVFHFGGTRARVARRVSIRASRVLPSRVLPSRVLPSRILLLIALVVAPVLIFAPLYGAAIVAVIALLGAAAVIWAWPNVEHHQAGQNQAAAGDRSVPLRRAAFVWATIAVLGCCWELAMYFLSRASAAANEEFPPLSDLIDPVVANPLGRVIFVLLWLLIGASLLTRGKRA